MLEVLQAGVGPSFGCASFNNNAFAGENGSPCSAFLTPQQLKSRDGFNSKQTRSAQYSSQWSTQISTRGWNLRASSNDVRAEASGNTGDDSDTVFAPLEQLQRLVADREAADLSGEVQSRSILYQRIKEVKDQERRKAVEGAIYALVVQNCKDAGFALIPKIQAKGKSRYVDIAPGQDRELEALHSPEAFEMVREHLAVVASQVVSKQHWGLVLGCQGTSRWLGQLEFELISKQVLGQFYAASILFGYCLSRVDQRFQLEKKALPATTIFVNSEPIDQKVCKDPARSGALGTKASTMRSYCLSFDAEVLQQFATVRAEESLNAIEKRVEALFGKPESGAGDDTIEVSLSAFRRLLLEAVAFGSFLWDVEIHVDSHYGLISQQ